MIVYVENRHAHGKNNSMFYWVRHMKLSDISVLFDCPHSTAPDEGEGYPLIRTPNVGKGRLILDRVHRVSKETYDIRNKRAIPRENDIIFAREAPAGNAALITKGQSVCLGQRTVLIRPNTDKVDARYLVYYLLDPHQQMKLLGYSHGATVGHVNIPDIANLTITLPDISRQKRIADIIDSFDNLIEINNKRIKDLEQMAENLYKEWFVRFRFPGHETAEFENGIPKGWIHCKFNEIYNTVRGVSYSSDEIDCDDGMDLINLKNIQAYGGFRKDGTKKYCGRYKSEQIVEKNSLVMGVTDMTQERRTVGSVALVPDLKGVISADLILLQSEISNVFSYYHFKVGGYSRLFSEFGNGANVIHLKPDLIRNQKILVPTNSLVNLFEKKATRITDQINNLEHQIDILIKQRNLLLPRLMSGKLEVE